MDVNKNILNNENSIKGLVDVNAEEISRYNVNPNDLFFTRTSETSEEIGLSSAYMGKNIDCVFSGFILRARAKIKSINSLFYAYYFRNPMNRQKIIKHSSITTRALISGSSLYSMKIKLTSLEEQEKIAEFLSSIDMKITLLKEQLNHLNDFKKFCLQQLFAQKLRFKKENGENYSEWKVCKVKDIFKERSEKGYEKLELLSVTLGNGVQKRAEIDAKDNSSDKRDKYKHVLPGDLVYNSMRMWQGASGVTEYEGIVSPAYTVLNPLNIINPLFYGYYFKTNEMIYKFKKYSQGLTSDTWNLKYPLISEISIKNPSLKEQNRIVNFLNLIDKKIQIQRNHIEEVKKFKKGLLQQMLISNPKLIIFFVEF
jgi:type I restriction enzyme S subunit